MLLSDGKNTLGVERPARGRRSQRARRRRSPIYTIALGTDSGEVVQQDAFGFVQRIPVPPDKATLREIARIDRRALLRGRQLRATPRRSTAASARALTSQPEQREVTVAFAGGAFVLLLAGGALSLVWFGRRLPG